MEEDKEKVDERESSSTQPEDYVINVSITDHTLQASAIDHTDQPHDDQSSSLDLPLMSIFPPSSPPSLPDSSSPTQQPSLDLIIAPPSTATSSSSNEPELVQEAKKLKLTTQQTPSQSPSPSSPTPMTSLGPRIPLSSIPPANQRPLFKPRLGRPPLPPPRPGQLQETQLSLAAPSSDHAVAASPMADFLLHGNEARLRAKFSEARQRVKTKKIKTGRVMETGAPPGPSPLKPGPPPYELVKKVVSELKEFINDLVYTKAYYGKSQPQPPSDPPVKARGTTSPSAPIEAHGTASNLGSPSAPIVAHGTTSNSALIRGNATQSPASFSARPVAHGTTSNSASLSALISGNFATQSPASFSVPIAAHGTTPNLASISALIRANATSSSSAEITASSSVSHDAALTVHATSSDLASVSAPIAAHATSNLASTSASLSGQITAHATSSSLSPSPSITAYATTSDLALTLAPVTSSSFAPASSNSPYAQQASSSSGVAGSSSAMEAPDCPPTVEDVIDRLDEYLETIPRMVSAQEMEDRLQSFQISVEADPIPSWYSLMKKSKEALWDCLTDYFICETLEDDDDDDEEEEGDPDSFSLS